MGLNAPIAYQKFMEQHILDHTKSLEPFLHAVTEVGDTQAPLQILCDYYGVHKMG